jgi:hypothetical protein
MIGKELLTALLFYLPFLLTIVFGVFTMAIGILAIFSGTMIVLFLATYGLYALLRDIGFIEMTLLKMKQIWQYISHDVERNLQQSFLFRNEEKLPDKPALFLCHPHGLIGYSWMLHFCYGLHPWPSSKLKPYVAIHSILFRLPLVRDVLEQFRCIEAKEETIKEYLNQGNSVAIVTGGIEEMLYNGDSSVKLVLKKRKGYARIAKRCGVPLVPMFTVGENELFPNEPFWLWQQIAGVVYKWTGIYVPLPSWTSMKQWSRILRNPLDTPVETFVLGVLDTQNKEESAIRNECMEMYTKFFKEKNIAGKIVS